MAFNYSTRTLLLGWTDSVFAPLTPVRYVQHVYGFPSELCLDILYSYGPFLQICTCQHDSS